MTSAYKELSFFTYVAVEIAVSVGVVQSEDDCEKNEEEEEVR